MFHEVLCKVQSKTFPEDFNIGQAKGEIDRNIFRERVYVVFPLFQGIHTLRVVKALQTVAKKVL